MPQPILIGIDTGGTFTDLVAFQGRVLRVHKVLSTPDDPARAVLKGLRELLDALAQTQRSESTRSGFRSDLRISYGSTVATNAVLEGKGGRVVLLTTAGFEDLLEIGRQTRPDLYALEPRKPEPLVPRARRIGITERVAFDGHVLQPLTGSGLQAAVKAVRQRRGESVAVCFLHSHANPAHERAVGNAVRRIGVPCSLSHQLVAEYREFERLSTTVINAFVVPVMTRHLEKLRRGVGTASLRVMQSNGGAVSVRTACREAVRTLLSGPAGGVMGAIEAGRRHNIERLISFDMGGTSTDVCLVDRSVQQQMEWSIAGHPVKVPAIDIHTVGAGGGSLAYCDLGGALKVGPQSAGADPGPACYGRGDKPTVTDADLVLGRLMPQAFLGGRMSLDIARAERALGKLARQLRLDLQRTAEGVVRVVNAGMERAIRRISVERGHDPREYVLLSFGGAGGMHACELAAALDMRRVLVPYHPGLLSARGAASAGVQRDYVQTVRLVDPSAADIERRLALLLRQARREMREEGRELGTARRAALAVFLDVRYRGQSYEIRVPFRRNFAATFHALHERLYGYADRARPIEVVNLRLIASIPGPKLPRHRVDGRHVAPQPHRLLWGGRWLKADCYPRDCLPANRRFAGPLVITEFSATTVVAPGWTARAFDDGDLLLERR